MFYTTQTFQRLCFVCKDAASVAYPPSMENKRIVSWLLFRHAFSLNTWAYFAQSQNTIQSVYLSIAFRAARFLKEYNRLGLLHVCNGLIKWLVLRHKDELCHEIIYGRIVNVITDEKHKMKKYAYKSRRLKCPNNLKRQDG